MDFMEVSISKVAAPEKNFAGPLKRPSLGEEGSRFDYG